MGVPLLSWEEEGPKGDGQDNGCPGALGTLPVAELGSRDAPYWTACPRSAKQVGSGGERWAVGEDDLPDPTDRVILPIPPQNPQPGRSGEVGGRSGHGQGTWVRNWGRHSARPSSAASLPGQKEALPPGQPGRQLRPSRPVQVTCRCRAEERPSVRLGGGLRSAPSCGPPPVKDEGRLRRLETWAAASERPPPRAHTHHCTLHPPKPIQRRRSR